MQTAARFVRVAIELTARMQLHKNQLDGWATFFGGGITRNTASIIRHRYGTVGLDAYLDRGGMTSLSLVESIVDDFVSRMMQARPVIGVTDIHARPLLDGLQAFQQLDVAGIVVTRM